jgi:hypothetical protein
LLGRVVPILLGGLVLDGLLCGMQLASRDVVRLLALSTMTGDGGNHACGFLVVSAVGNDAAMGGGVVWLGRGVALGLDILAISIDESKADSSCSEVERQVIDSVSQC